MSQDGKQGVLALELTASLSIGAGGLQAAVGGLTDHLAMAGVSAEAWAMLDGGDGPFPSGCKLFGSVPIPGFRIAPGMGAAIAKAGHQILHLHGLWNFASLVALRWPRERPKIISPHGMFSVWALRRSSWKKRLARALYEDRNFKGCACWHALSRAEYLAIRRIGFRQPVAIIPNGVELPPPLEAGVGSSGKVLLYLGRFHPVKNLEALLQAWDGLNPQKKRGWRLRMCGWGDAAYEQKLRGLGRKDVEWKGPVFSHAKEAVFRDAAAFVLPSLSEALPMSVLEAWSYGLPVLMSGACSLPEGFDSLAAFDTGTTVNSVGDALGRMIALNDGDRGAMGVNGLNLVKERFAWSTVAQSMAEVYRWVLGAGPKPNCVVLD